MYQRFLDDPNSVDPAWHEFFADYRPGDASPTSGTAAQTAADTTAAPSPLTPIAEARQAPGAAPRPPASRRGPAAPRARRSPSAPPRSPPRAPLAGRSTPGREPRQAADGVATALRGAASLVVKNMNASLAVPTATSVRAVPGQAAGRQPRRHQQPAAPHPRRQDQLHALIGYAVVEALAEFPVMNRHFAEVDGKPTVVQPEHVNLGLAIDLPGKGDGERTLVVVSIKGCEAMSFAQFWSAYEDVVRKARAGALTAEDFAGTTISPDQPRHAGHQPLRAAADAGPGHDRRRRRDGVPRRVPGRQRRDAWPRSASARSSR